MVFPESHRNPEAGLQEGMPGVALMAVKTQTPILPVGIAGSENVGPLWRVAVPTGNISVTIGEPFTLPEVKGKLEPEQLKRMMDDGYVAHCGLSARTLSWRVREERPAGAGPGGLTGLHPPGRCRSQRTMEAQTTSERKPTLKERLTTVASALQHRNYRLYFTGLLFSITGFQMLLVIQGWLIWDITGDPKALAYLGGVTAVPTVLLNLYGGVIADRFDQRLLIMLVSTTICLLLLVMATLVTLEMANLWNLLLLAFLIAGAQAFDNPARQALYPHLIARKDLMNAVALNSIVWQGTRVVGPLIAGLLIAGVGPGPALYIAAAGFACMVVAMTAIRVPPIPRAAGGSMVQNLVEGIGYVIKNQVFAVLIGLTFLNSFFGMSFIILLPIFATDILNVGPEGLGEMHAVGGVGAIVMALVAAAMSKSRNKGLWLVGGAVLFGMTNVLFALSTNYALSLAVLFVGGAAATFYMVMVQTSLQALVPDHLRGRVFSIYSLTWSLLPLGGLQAGLVADLVSPQFAVALGGVVVAVVAVSVLLLRQVRIVGITTQQALDRASA